MLLRRMLKKPSPISNSSKSRNTIPDHSKLSLKPASMLSISLKIGPTKKYSLADFSSRWADNKNSMQRNGQQLDLSPENSNSTRKKLESQQRLRYRKLKSKLLSILNIPMRRKNLYKKSLIRRRRLFQQKQSSIKLLNTKLHINKSASLLSTRSLSIRLLLNISQSSTKLLNRNQSNTSNKASQFLIRLSSIKLEDRIRLMSLKLSTNQLQKSNTKLSIKSSTSLLNTKSQLNQSQLKRKLNTRLKLKSRKRKRRKKKSTSKMMDGLSFLQKKEKMVKTNDSLLNHLLFKPLISFYLNHLILE